MALQKRFNFGRAGTLFNRKTIKRELTKRRFDPVAEQLKAAMNWAEQVRHPNFHKAKETAVRGEFIQTVLVTLLGYTPYRAGETFTVATEEALGKGAVDTALGTFSGSERTILAPFELKGPGTHDLDAIMPGRNKSPVQQAWEYAIDAPGAKWVLVSNCAEIRLYAFGHGRELYETWDLGLLDDPQERERLWLLVGAQNLLFGRTAALLDESANEQKDITNKLYVDYKKTRDTLIQTLKDQPPRLRGARRHRICANDPRSRSLHRLRRVDRIVARKIDPQGMGPKKPVSPERRLGEFRWAFRGRGQWQSRSRHSGL
jgi:hypothetical protein